MSILVQFLAPLAAVALGVFAIVALQVVAFVIEDWFDRRSWKEWDKLPINERPGFSLQRCGDCGYWVKAGQSHTCQYPE